MSSSCGGVASTCEANVRRLESRRFAREAPSTRGRRARAPLRGRANHRAAASARGRAAAASASFGTALRLTPRKAGIFLSRRYEFDASWSGGALGETTIVETVLDAERTINRLRPTRSQITSGCKTLASELKFTYKRHYY